MKRWGVICLVALGPVLESAPHGLEGNWMGLLEAGPVRLRLVLHVVRSPQGTLSATLDSLDQSAYGIPVSRLEQDGAAVKLEIHRIGASFSGVLDESRSRITGQFRQSGAELPLTWEHFVNLPSFSRPQEPKRPFPYNEVEVSYENKAARVRLAGTLTVPRSAGPHPAVLLITGSGPQDRNESLAGHRPFLVISDFLTRHGIAVLRADDRGTGQSTGDFYSSTTEDFAGDALAGVEFLKSRKEIDAKRIGLIGHSEGGIIAPIVASRSADLAFIVLLAGSGVPGEEILYDQSYRIAKAMGVPEEAAVRLREVNRAIYRIVRAEPDAAAARRKIHEHLVQWNASLNENQRAAMAGMTARVEAQLQFATSPWFRAFLAYDPRPALRRVHMPVLALNGELDLQVSAAVNLPAIVKALEAGGNPDYAVVKMPRLNHLFQTSSTGSPAEYAQIEETIAPTVLKIMAEWIVRHVKPNGGLPGAGSP